MALLLTVPTNWDDQLLDFYTQVISGSRYRTKIGQIYGGVPTIIGDGRLDIKTSDVRHLRSHIEIIHDIGIKFNFLLNAPSMCGLEHSREHRSHIIDTLKWVEDLGVDVVTISNPFLGELVLYHMPRLKVKISTIMDIKAIQAVRLLRTMTPAIDSITLSYNINREFATLREILDRGEVKIELLANIICFLNCPYQWYHYDLVGNFTKLGIEQRMPFEDYDPIGCDIVRLSNIEEVIKCPWIRPEDTTIYEDLGVHSIKLAGRTMPTAAIVNMVDAYSCRHYNGNLWDLVAPWAPIYVDNSGLNGFIDFFLNKDFSCNARCGTCRYCHDLAYKTVKLKPGAQAYILRLTERLKARVDTSFTPKKFEYSPDTYFNSG